MKVTGRPFATMRNTTMSGRFMKLRAGRYTLMVPSGHGPAGVHREASDIRLDRRGGRASFEVPTDERVYFWWRGPTEPPGIRIVGHASTGRDAVAAHPSAAGRAPLAARPRRSQTDGLDNQPRERSA